MIRSIALVFFGGGVGAVLRYLVNVIMTKYVDDNLYWATLLVNVLGCLLFGIITAVVLKTTLINHSYALALTTGFCGAFTTFSTFAFENINMMNSGQIALSLGYIALSVILGISACYVGLKII